MPKVTAGRYKEHKDKVDWFARLYALVENEKAWTHGNVHGFKVWREAGDLFTLRLAIDIYTKTGVPAYTHLFFHAFGNLQVLARKAVDFLSQLDKRYEEADE